MLPQVRVFKGHPAGVVSVRFVTDEGAQEALRVMGGRFFGGRRISAELWDGITNYNVKVGGGGAHARALEGGRTLQPSVLNASVGACTQGQGR